MACLLVASTLPLSVGLTMVLSGGARPAAAQSEPAAAQSEPPTPMVEVIDYSAVVGPDEPFSMRLGIGGFDPSNLTIEVTIHDPITSIEELDEEPGRVVSDFEARPLIDFVVESAGVVTVRIPTLTPASAETTTTADPGDSSQAEPDAAAEAEPNPGLIIEEAGVYPLVVTVTETSQAGTGDDNNEQSKASATITLIRKAGPSTSSEDLPARAPTPVVVLLDIGLSTETATPSGSGQEYGVGALSVEQATEILTDNPELAVNILLRRASIERLLSDPVLTARFAEAVAGRPVVGEPLRRLDPAALAAIGQWRLYRRAGQRTATELVGLSLSPEPTVAAVSAPITESATVALIAEGFTTVLDTTSVTIPESAPVAAPIPTEPARMTTVAGELLVVPVDGASPADGLRDGHRWLAELAIATLAAQAQEADGGEDTAVEVAPDDVTMIRLGSGLDPVATARPVLEGLKTTSWFEPLTLSDGLAGLTLETRPAAARPAQDLSALTEPLAKADRLLATYSSFYVDGPHPPSDYLLALSDATAVETEPEARTASVEAVSAQLETAMEVVSLPEDQSVTLAARSASIPLTIENASDGTREVELRFRTDRLIVSNDRLVIAVPPGSSVIDIEVEARSLGTSPLAITVLTPDGQRSLASTRFRVRSTAVPGLGLLLSIGGLSMLGVWWFLSIRRSRAAQPNPENEDPVPGPTRGSIRDAVTTGDSVEA